VLLGIVLLISAAVLCVAVLWVLGQHLLRPARMTDGKALYILKRLSPEDLGLAYESIDFQVRDSATGAMIRIAGWWMPTLGARKTVLILHGYCDAKVGGIAWAPVWASLGFNVLAIDLRAHGESGGKHSTAGYFERDDADQVVDQIRQLKPEATSNLILFGVSLGATVAAGLGARRDDLNGVIMESPYVDFRHAIAAHGRRLAMPLEWGYGIACTIAERISGAHFDQVRPIDLARQVRCPLLVIHAGADTFVSADQIDEYARMVAEPNPIAPRQHVIIDDVQHTRGLLKDPVAYRAMLEAFVAST
jgi:alpha-beta hydrolase superfamily lysophospholipase